MAIRLEYETCLFEEALDAGVADYLQVQDKREKQTEERESFEKSEKERQEQLEADGETFEPVVKEWEEIYYKPYLTKKVQFVACLNTMGQDRKFTEEERLFALRTV
jgi:DNA/RNA-binding domain of Phe-tRNA-synthetase-like protein